MKRSILTALAITVFIACSAQKNFPKGIVPGNYTTVEMLAISNPKEGQTIFNTDTKTLYAFDGSVWIDQGAGGGGSGTVDAILIDGSTNPVRNDAIFDRFGQVVDMAPDSPTSKLYFWQGNKAEFAGRTPLDNTFYHVTDSVPPTPPDGGDMEKATYDTDTDDIVDNAENLNGQPPSFYLDDTTLDEAAVDAFVANNGYSTDSFPAGTTSYTPTISASISDSYTISSATGEYYQMGKFVHVRLIVLVINGAGTGTLRISLPVTASGGSAKDFLNVDTASFGADYYSIQGEVSSDHVFITYQSDKDGSNFGTALNMSFTNCTIRISGTYIAQ